MKKSIMAGILISMGVCALLNSQYSYLAMILFAFGLYTICKYQLDLFTGKCGYVINAVTWKDCVKILFINLLVAYICGLFIATPEITEYAKQIVSKWNISILYMVKSIFCGMIMFIAVETYKKGSLLGIFFGVPLFIICGFQHCIANAAIMGAAITISPVIIIAIIGNWIGAIIANVLLREV